MPRYPAEFCDFLRQPRPATPRYASFYALCVERSFVTFLALGTLQHQGQTVSMPFGRAELYDGWWNSIINGILAFGFYAL